MTQNKQWPNGVTLNQRMINLSQNSQVPNLKPMFTRMLSNFQLQALVTTMLRFDLLINMNQKAINNIISHLESTIEIIKSENKNQIISNLLPLILNLSSLNNNLRKLCVMILHRELLVILRKKSQVHNQAIHSILTCSRKLKT